MGYRSRNKKWHSWFHTKMTHIFIIQINRPVGHSFALHSMDWTGLDYLLLKSTIKNRINHKLCGRICIQTRHLASKDRSASSICHCTNHDLPSNRLDHAATVLGGQVTCLNIFAFAFAFCDGGFLFLLGHFFIFYLRFQLSTST